MGQWQAPVAAPVTALITGGRPISACGLEHGSPAFPNKEILALKKVLHHPQVEAEECGVELGLGGDPGNFVRCERGRVRERDLRLGVRHVDVRHDLAVDIRREVVD